MATTRKPEVLVVDDEPSITEWLCRKLSAKYTVTQGHGVADALLAIGLRAPDVLVSDLGMDAGGGEQLLAAVADAFPDIKRVVHSAAPQDHLRRTVDTGLAHSAVEKGADLDAIDRVLTQLLASGERPMRALTPTAEMRS